MRTDPVPPTGPQSAAVLLMLLGEEEASEVLRRLEPGEVQQLGAAMFEVADVSEGQVEGVFDRFAERARARPAFGFQPAPRIRSAMARALGEPRAEAVMARITPRAEHRALHALRWLDAPAVAALIEREHPQLAALVLSHLEPAVAAEVVQRLPAEAQPDLLYRVATLGPVTPDALDELDRLLSAARSAPPAAPPRGGAGDVAQIMNALPPGQNGRLIGRLAKLDKRLAQRIEDEMFVFDDLDRMDEKNLGTLFRAVDNGTLVMALKGAADPLRERILGCMSSRAAQGIRDELAELGPKKLAEVQDAQKAVLATARRLADEGAISLGGGSDDYV